MSKNNLVCLVLIAISMAIVAILTTNYVIKEKNNNSFQLRTLNEMSELEDIYNNELEELKFRKTVHIYGSILHLNEKNNVDQYKDWCAYVHEDYDKKIITLIEDRVEIPKKDLDKFLLGYKKLKNLCLK